MTCLVGAASLATAATVARATGCPDLEQKLESIASESYYVGAGVYHGVYDKALALLPMAKALRTQLVDMLAPPPAGQGSTVLDLGCGTGRIGVAIQERFPGSKLTGVDYSRDMAAAAEANGYSRDRLFTGEVDGNLKLGDWAAKVPDHVFDNVTMNMVSYMLEPAQLGAVMRHASAKLKPGGRFVLSIIERSSDRADFLRRLEVELRSIPELTEAEIKAVMDANTGLTASLITYTVPEVQAMGEAAGLRLVGSAPTYGGTATLLAFEAAR
jgi:SAM-dependent methyltransferase